MSIFDNENFIDITVDDLNDAAIIAKNVDDNIEKRAFANVLGARLGIKYLSSLGIKSDNFNSMYTIPAVLKDIDISDITTENGIKVDVRVVKDANSVCIPKSHFDYEITPDIYIFIIPAQDFMSADFLGAISPEEVDKSVTDGKYYFISSNNLYNENSLKNVLKNGKSRQYAEPSENEIIKAEGLLVNFIDKDILNKEKLYLYSILKRSSKLRDMFKDFENFEKISTELSHTDEILSDSVLDILGAQQLYKNDDGTADFGEVDLDELAEITANDFVEDFIDDNKDDIMPDNENIIEGEFEELPETNDSTDNFSEFESIENLENLSDNELGDNLLEPLPSDEDLANLATDDFTQLEDIEPGLEIDSDEQLETFAEAENLEETGNNSDISFEDFDISSEIKPDEISENLSIEDITEEIADTDIEEIKPFDVDEDFSTQPDNTETIEEIKTENETDDDSEISNTVENEFNIEDIDNGELLESFDTPQIDLTLPELVPDEEMPFFEEMQEAEKQNELNNTENDINAEETGNFSEDANSDFSLDDNTNSEFAEGTETEILQPIDDIAQEINFEQPLGELPNLELDDGSAFAEIEEVTPEPMQSLDSVAEEINFEEPADITDNSNEIQAEQELSDLTLDNIAEDVNFDNIDMNDIENIDTESFNLEEIDAGEPAIAPVVEQVAAGPQDEIQHEEHSSSNKNSSYEDEDMSGLEEFTMDMAEEEEKSNPNIRNPKFAADMRANEESQPFSDSEIMGFDVPDNTTSNQTDYTSQGESIEDLGFNFEDNSSSTQPQQDSINLDDINLDELDDFGDDTSTSTDSQIDEFSDIDIDSLNVDDLDMSNIDMNNINIDDIGIDSSDFDNINTNEYAADDMGALENIPEVPNNIPNEQYNTGEYNNPQMPNDYVPDFEGNDKGTIEALYQDNTANQMPGENMDNSFNQNNVNVQMPSKPKKKKTSPLLGIALIVLVCAFAFTKKDLIMEKINANKGVTVQDEQNMPIEGETKEDKEDQALLQDNTPPEGEQNADAKQGIGEIPGEEGGPQDAASMEASLKQNKNNIESLPNNTYSKTPEPLTSSQIKRLYWEIPQELTYNDSIVKYLKTVGKTMKFAIQSDLLNISEMPYSNKMIINVVINKDGNADNVTTSVSSGSKQIDSIVLQTVKAALKYVKAPTSEFKNDSYNFSLIINF